MSSWLQELEALLAGQFVTREEFERELKRVERRIMAAEQADIDALTTEVQQVQTDLDTAKQQLQSEIDSLASANPTLDITGLQNAVAPLDSAVQALGNLQPTPPGP